MTEHLAARASARRHVLAEGPVWVADRSRVLWIDVERGSVFVGHLVDRWVEPVHQLDFDGRIGAAVPGDDGSILVATHDRLVVVEPDGQRTDGPTITGAGSGSRSNDGACDPRGRFVVGTLPLDEGAGRQQERLYRWELDGSLTVIDSDLMLSNGIAWSPDGSVMYSTDTMRGVVWARQYDVETGRLGPRREHLHLVDGHPDGICVDARGHLWVAVWGGGEVRSFSPSGEPGDTVRVDAPHVSSVAFVGEHLETLLLTTASRDLSPADLDRYPGAGCLFVADVGVVGAPTTPWASATFLHRSDSTRN
ncbi:SMP-30/gluconolactonase/LRE family protein [Cellulomonas sp. McL0617]|uniref:SMP-30/gluconolactonase/LRE family protein n=1 Tax=Cellulomonas sp. McL0617 TaxID=3415675 RepID=UPI003CF5B296